jgi:hypothetical protein
MHDLEHLLFLAALRIKDETGNDRLAEDVMALASASHDYRPPEHFDAQLSKWNAAWTRRYQRLAFPEKRT